MAIHKFSTRLTFECTQYFTDQFDTKDQDKWNSIKALAKVGMSQKEFDALPDEAPEDIEVWFAAYLYVNTTDLGHFNQENGEVTSESIICDEDDNIVHEE
jgi:hypothetical protein